MPKAGLLKSCSPQTHLSPTIYSQSMEEWATHNSRHKSLVHSHFPEREPPCLLLASNTLQAPCFLLPTTATSFMLYSQCYLPQGTPSELPESFLVPSSL